ncbi:hypothetical protein ACFY20_26285 [Streptomyces sp. NPDC001312]|uniref:hypothetical protein n=1 Tax=Streptomyces sp. NPDC001312 TaxID=3364561 RepID=UPI00367665CC
MPDTWMLRDSPQATVPTGTAPADHAPVERFSQPSEVTAPVQSRTTVTAMGVPSARHRPTVAVGVVSSSQSEEAGHTPTVPVTVYAAPSRVRSRVARSAPSQSYVVARTKWVTVPSAAVSHSTWAAVVALQPSGWHAWRVPLGVYGAPVAGSTVRVPTRSPLLVS